jgi:choline dehydrogenase
VALHPETESDATFDYVVIGSGAGGGPVAGNLARAGCSVLLIEAGDDCQSQTYRVPAFHAYASEDPEMCWNFFVRHYARDEQQRRDPKFTSERDGVLYPRGATLGGCTANNAMIVVYPHNRDWDYIAELTGDRSWASDNMRGYFERLEQCTHVPRPLFRGANGWLAAVAARIPLVARRLVNVTRHGFDGWLGTSLPNVRDFVARADRQLIDIVLAAAKATLEDDLKRALEHPEGILFPDPNDWQVQSTYSEGLWRVPLATFRGARNGTRDYIRSVEESGPGKLTVQLNALATRILLDGENRAIGVEYLEGPHLYAADPRVANADPRSRRAFAAREVILAAGTFNTPQLLMLSGIGPGEELARFDIKVRVELPGVGKNLQDRYEVGVISEMDRDFELLRGCPFDPSGEPATDPCLAEWERGEGVYASNGAILAIIKRSRPERPDPDLFIFGLPAYFAGYEPGYSTTQNQYRNFFTWAILKAHTQNTAGTVRLSSSDPRTMPEINFHYFEEGTDQAGEDLDSVVAGIEFVRHMMSRVGVTTQREVLPGEHVRSRAGLETFVRDHAWGHHASGTCKIGWPEDRMAVVDSRFRVFGTKGLRIVDASVFPRIPGFFIVTPTYMISEKASDVIIQDARAGT